NPDETEAGRAIVSAEISGEQNLAVGLHGHCKDERILIVAFDNLRLRAESRIKRGVETAVRIQAGDPVAFHTIHVGKESADHDYAVRLKGHVADPITRASVKTWVDGAIVIKSRNEPLVHSVERCEVTANEYFAVRLWQARFNNAARRSGSRIEGGIHAAVFR